MITLNEIHKSYHMGEQDLHVLRGISFTINAGDYVAIMGPSGSGKSTLMNIIGCLDVADSGEYRLGDELVADMTDDQLAQLRNRKIGFVFQAFNLIPRITALRQVSLPLMYAGFSKDEREERAAEMLDMVGLGDRKDHRPDQLSGGQQQRVAIARALGMSPTILLADEPTGNLDTASGMEIMGLFRKLNDEGKTIIMITHEPEIAEQTRRQIHLRDGLILSDSQNGKHPKTKTKK